MISSGDSWAIVSVEKELNVGWESDSIILSDEGQTLLYDGIAVSIDFPESQLLDLLSSHLLGLKGESISIRINSVKVGTVFTKRLFLNLLAGRLFQPLILTYQKIFP